MRVLRSFVLVVCAGCADAPCCEASSPQYAFNLADPLTITVEIVYSNTEFGFYLAHMLCAWCLFVSYPSLYILVVYRLCSLEH